MANSLSGGQLNTYNPFLPITTSTTAGTQNLIVYPVSAEGVQGGITNTATQTSGTAATNVYYDGITHFKNISGINSLNLGPAGAEIPLTDKQAVVVTTCTVSAASAGWVVAPFLSTLSGYWTQATAAVAASTPSNFCAIYAGSSASGGLIATINNAAATGGGPGDTYSWTCATPSTVIAGGTPLSLNFNTTVLGTAYTQIITTVFTRVGI